MTNDKYDIERKSRDEQLARALAQALADAGAPGDCLSDQDLAALLDRTASSDERERFQAHIASCDDCLARFRMAAQLQVPMAHPVRRRRYGYAAGLAALAAGLVAVIMARQQPVLQTAQTSPRASAAPAPQGTPEERSIQAGLPPAAPGTGKGKVDNGQRKTPRPVSPEPLTAVALAEAVYESVPAGAPIIRHQGKSYGFSGSVSPGIAAFRTGAAAIDLVVAIKGGDAAARGGAVERLADLLGKDWETVGLKELLQDGTRAELLHRYLKVASQIEQHAEQQGQALNFRLGAWCEAGLLVGDDKIGDFVDLEAVRSLSEGIKGEDLPEGVRRSLGDLDALLGSPSATGNQFRQVRRILEEIVEMY